MKHRKTSFHEKTVKLKLKLALEYHRTLQPIVLTIYIFWVILSNTSENYFRKFFLNYEQSIISFL